MPDDVNSGARRRAPGAAWRRGAGGVLSLLVLLTVAEPLSAATVYRCGPGGTVFSQTPCLHEDGQRLEVNGEVSGARQAEALEVSRREAATARTMSRHGAARPARASGTRAAVIPLREVSVGGAAQPAKALRPKRRAPPRDFTAKVPKPATLPKGAAPRTASTP